MCVRMYVCVWWIVAYNYCTHIVLRLLSCVVSVVLQEDPTLTLADFQNVRHNPKTCKGFFPFFNIVVTSVAGCRAWDHATKSTSTISGCGRVSVSDEAFAELLLLNYWDWWFKSGAARWTDSRIGNVEFQGWSVESHATFNNIYRRIQSQRANKSQNEVVDNHFRSLHQQKYGLMTAKRQRSLKRTHVAVEALVDDW